MAKNLIICCDGTSNELGNRNSNVIRLYSVLARSPSQLVYYHPGLGTGGEINAPTYWDKLRRTVKHGLGMAIGYGIMSNVAWSYRFLMENYEPGDKIFIFGFSRGAYTAKAVASMLKMFGLLDKGNWSLVEYLIEILKRKNKDGKPDFAAAARYKKTFSRESKPHFLGLWDTVSSVGLAWNPMSLPYTCDNDDIAIGRHAVSIDERRAFFRTNLWEAPDSPQDLKEVWFAGDHSDVGGGHEGANQSLPNITLSWMIREAEAAGAIVDPDKVKRVLSGAKANLNVPDVIHNELHRFFWKLAEYIPKRQYDMVAKTRKMNWWPLRNQLRPIPEEAFIHDSVRLRLADPAKKYAPKNLPTNPRYTD